MRFTVCVIQRRFTACFDEFADSVEWGLRRLGHEVFRSTSILPETRGIVFGLYSEPVPDDCILVNCEQLADWGNWQESAHMRRMYATHTVWEYSIANASRFPQFGLAPPSVVRPGFADCLQGRVPQVEKTHDVVFFGSSNDRRAATLVALEQAGVSVLRVPFDTYGSARDEFLARARVCINIHYALKDSIFEAVRISPLIHNNIAVLSEETPSGEELEWGVAVAPYEGLVQAAADILRQNRWPEIARKQMQSLLGKPIVEDLRYALEKLETTSGGLQATPVARTGGDGEQEATGLTGVMVQGRELPGMMEQATGDKASGEAGLGTDAVMEQGRHDTRDGKLPEVVAQDADVAKSDGVQAITVQHQLPELTLNMIVKNEAGIIERCLSSVRPYLKGWCIVDTGSTDGTQDIIRRTMQGVPGELHEKTWKEYDGSRTEAIELAGKFSRGRGWLLLIDADEIFQLDGDLVLPDGYDCYDGWITRCEGCVRWARSLFARANKPWFYEMPRHEGLYCRVHAPTAPRPVSNARVLSTYDGARAKDPGRFLRDAQALEAWLPKHPGHARGQYYLAQSYKEAASSVQPLDRNCMQKAIMHYLKRADMAGYNEETFSAMYQAAQCMSACGYPWERTQQQLMKAWNFRPSRVEPIYNIARYYRESRQFSLAEIFARKAAMTPMSEDKFPDFDLSVYAWRAKEELAVALTYLNGHAEARDLNLAIIDLVPPHERERIQENLDMCLREAPLPQK